MSPQHSNRDALLEGALRCLERLPPERVTARVIAAEAGANAASIAYHFGSKDELVSAAVVAGLDRWLEEIAEGLRDAAAAEPAVRIERATAVIARTRRRHAGLAANFVGALARAQHDPQVRARLAEGFLRARDEVAALLGLGDDEPGADAAQLVVAMFDGLLFQGLLAPELALGDERLLQAQRRLRSVLPG